MTVTLCDIFRSWLLGSCSCSAICLQQSLRIVKPAGHSLWEAMRPNFSLVTLQHSLSDEGEGEAKKCLCVYIGLWKSKKHRKQFSPENPFPGVFRDGEHVYSNQTIFPDNDVELN